VIRSRGIVGVLLPTCLAIILLAGACAAQSTPEPSSPPRSSPLGPPPLAPLTSRDVASSYDVGLEPAVRDSSTRAALLIAPIPFYNSQLGAGAVGVAGALKVLGHEATTPPSFAGLLGLATTNGSWGVGLGTRLHLDEDAWRLLGGGGWFDIRYSFYGVGQRQDQSITLRQTMSPLLAEGLRRVAPSFYLGLRTQYNRVQIRVDTDSLPPELVPYIVQPEPYTEVIVAPRFQVDTRNDQMYPTHGWLIDATASYLSSAFGSDSTMHNYTGLVTYQHGWSEDKNVIAAACQVCASAGEVPIDQLCIVGAINGLRGYEPGRYMDRSQLTVQAEYRRSFGRFGVTGFTGAAQTARTLGELDTNGILFAGGVGLRYRLLRRFPINYRVDTAFGKDGTQIYFSLGEAF